jgi:cytochrome c553
VVKNIAIVGTAQLLKQVALLLQSRRFEVALIAIRDHVKRLETVNRTIKDPLVEQDIATLNKYKALIAEQKKNPVRGAKIFLDLGRRKY